MWGSKRSRRRVKYYIANVHLQLSVFFDFSIPWVYDDLLITYTRQQICHILSYLPNPVILKWKMVDTTGIEYKNIKRSQCIGFPFESGQGCNDFFTAVAIEFSLNDFHWIQWIQWLMKKSKNGQVTRGSTYLATNTLLMVAILRTFTSAQISIANHRIEQTAIQIKLNYVSFQLKIIDFAFNERGIWNNKWPFLSTMTFGDVAIWNSQTAEMRTTTRTDASYRIAALVVNILCTCLEIRNNCFTFNKKPARI